MSQGRPLTFVAGLWLALTGCSASEPTLTEDASVDAEARCESPRFLVYPQPGCGGSVAPMCVDPVDTGCVTIVCGCDGRVHTYDCAGAHAPFLYAAPRGEEGSVCADAGVDAAADTVDGDTTDAAFADPSCPVGRLPSDGTPCDSSLMPEGSYCRLSSCDWGGEGDCHCRAGAWKCAMSARDGWGCGTPPRCFEPTSGYCNGTTDAGSTCLGTTVALYAVGPWDAAKGCWPSTRRFIDCVDGADAGSSVPTCFFRKTTGSYYLASSSQLPSGEDYRPCTDAERSSRSPDNRCE